MFTYAFLKQVNGVVLVFDVTSEESFKSLTVWMEHIYENASFDIPIVLVGNKIDLVEDRKVSTQQAEDFAANKQI